MDVGAALGARWPSRSSVTSTLPDTRHERDWPRSKLRNGVTLGLRRRRRAPSLAEPPLRIVSSIALIAALPACCGLAPSWMLPCEPPHQSSSAQTLSASCSKESLGGCGMKLVREGDLALALDEPEAAVGELTLRDSGSSLTARRSGSSGPARTAAGSGSRRSGIVSRGSVGASDRRWAGGRAGRPRRLPAVRWRASTRSWIERERRPGLERRAAPPHGGQSRVDGRGSHTWSRPYRPRLAPCLGLSGRSMRASARRSAGGRRRGSAPTPPRRRRTGGPTAGRPGSPSSAPRRTIATSPVLGLRPSTAEPHSAAEDLLEAAAGRPRAQVLLARGDAQRAGRRAAPRRPRPRRCGAGSGCSGSRRPTTSGASISKRTAPQPQPPVRGREGSGTPRLYARVRVSRTARLRYRSTCRRNRNWEAAWTSAEPHFASVIGPLFVGHGTQKLFGWFGGHGRDGTGAFFEQLGLKPGKRQATSARAAEAVGGALLTLGALTPVAAGLITGTMITAIRKVHLRRARGSPTAATSTTSR